MKTKKTDETILEKALQEIHEGRETFRTAELRYGINRGSLHRKFRLKYPAGATRMQPVATEAPRTATETSATRQQEKQDLKVSELPVLVGKKDKLCNKINFYVLFFICLFFVSIFLGYLYASKK